jgi:hypothetical protein
VRFNLFLAVAHYASEHCGGFMKSSEGSVSVPLPAELRDFVRQQAEREERSQAQVIRRLVAEAWKQARDTGRAA